MYKVTNVDSLSRNGFPIEEEFETNEIHRLLPSYIVNLLAKTRKEVEGLVYCDV